MTIFLRGRREAVFIVHVAEYGEACPSTGRATGTELLACLEPNSCHRRAIFLLGSKKYCSCECLYIIASLLGALSPFLHRKRICSTVSLACPQSHRPYGAASVTNRYESSLDILVLNWASTLASFHASWSYSFPVCR